MKEKLFFQYVCIEIKIVNVVDYNILIWILMDIYSLGEECVDVILSSWKGSYVYIDLSKKQPPRKRTSPPAKIFEQGENFHYIHNSAEEEKLFHGSQTTHISRETFSFHGFWRLGLKQLLFFSGKSNFKEVFVHL